MSLQERIESSPRKNGCFTIFIKLSKKRGLKLFMSEAGRDESYYEQQRASIYGLGPKVYKKIDSIIYDEFQMFGYYTEVVTVLNRQKVRDLVMRNPKAYQRIQQFVGILADELRDKMSDIGIDFWDNHIYNIGWKNGDVVCVDFGGSDCESLPTKFEIT